MSIKSDVNVANGQCDYPFKANIETTGQCCILLGAEFNYWPKYYSVGLGLCRLNYNSNEILVPFVCGKSYVLRLNRFQTDQSALFILDDFSSKYFQSVAQRIKMCEGIFKQELRSVMW